MLLASNDGAGGRKWFLAAVLSHTLGLAQGWRTGSLLALRLRSRPDLEVARPWSVAAVSGLVFCGVCGPWGHFFSRGNDPRRGSAYGRINQEIMLCASHAPGQGGRNSMPALFSKGVRMGTGSLHPDFEKARCVKFLFWSRRLACFSKLTLESADSR